MRKAFTLIELIVVIVIMGILSNITFDVLSKVYKNYVYTKEINKLSVKLDSAIELISSRLKGRVRNSVIVTKYPLKWTDSDDSKIDFKSISRVEDADGEYKIIEWIGKDYEAKNGMWDSYLNHIQTGWSGFIDLGYDTHKIQDDPKEFNLTSPDSNFTIVKLIDRNITKSLGYNEDPFDSNTTTLIFAGINGGGQIIEDINQSYGWYLDEDKNRTAKAVFGILDYNTERNSSGLYTNMRISSITENNDTVLWARYFMTRSAYALVPVENNQTMADGRKINDYNLTFIYNYQPWQGDWWNGTHGDSNHTLVASHITEVRFKKDVSTSILRLYICIQSPDIIIDKDNDRYLTLCKEKAIF
jgi:prepilin-type N-terminal cleavage/methylation domain-containing protein